MLRKRIKRDSLGRRTDRVKKRELDEMLRLRAQSLIYSEIAEKLNRKPQTVKRHIEAARQLYEEDRLPEKETIKQKEAQQIEHVRTLQGLVREFLDSICYPADKDNWDDLDQSYDSLWQAFKRIKGDARWPMLAAHLGDYKNAFYDMPESLEPPEIAKARATPGHVVITNYSKDDVIEIIEEAYAFISNSPLYLIAEKADTEEWKFAGLKPWCQWCLIQMPEPRNG